MIGYRRGMLTDGWFGWAGRSGMMLSDGYFWARRDGGYNFYLGRFGPSDIDLAHPAAACGSRRSEFQVPVALAAGDHFLAVTAISRFGRESAEHRWLRVRIDAEGGGVAVPAAVENLSWELSDGGRVMLRWEYPMRPGWPAPAEFRIYYAQADQPMAFDQPYACVPYRRSAWRYVWDGMGVAGHFAQRFAVRAATAAGVDDGSTRTIVAGSDDRPPGSIAFDARTV